MTNLLTEIHFDDKTFSRYPAGRYITDGKWSGEKFRKDLLFPVVGRGHQVSIFLDEAQGFGSSFLEEAFGGLIRTGVPIARAMELVKFESEDPSLIQEIHGYMLDASEP